MAKKAAKIVDVSPEMVDWLVGVAQDAMQICGNDLAEAWQNCGERGSPRIAEGDFVDLLYGSGVSMAVNDRAKNDERYQEYKALPHDAKSESLHQAVCRAFSVRRNGWIYL